MCLCNQHWTIIVLNNLFLEKTISFFCFFLKMFMAPPCCLPWELCRAFGSVMGRGNYAVQGICQGTERWEIKGDVMVAGVTALILSQDLLSLF